MLKKAWEQEDNKDELKIVLQGPERQFWLGTEAGYGREMDQHPKEEWVQAVSVFISRINVVWSEWAAKRRESTH